MFDLIKIVVIISLVWLQSEAHKIGVRKIRQNLTETFNQNEEPELIFAHVVSISDFFLSFRLFTIFLIGD